MIDGFLETRKGNLWILFINSSLSFSKGFPISFVSWMEIVPFFIKLWIFLRAARSSPLSSWAPSKFVYYFFFSVFEIDCRHLRGDRRGDHGRLIRQRLDLVRPILIGWLGRVTRWPPHRYCRRLSLPTGLPHWQEVVPSLLCAPEEQNNLYKFLRDPIPAVHLDLDVKRNGTYGTAQKNSMRTSGDTISNGRLGFTLFLSSYGTLDRFRERIRTLYTQRWIYD